MQVIAQTERVAAPVSSERRWLRDVIGVALIIAAGLAGYWLFPDNLALLTRVIAIALLVLGFNFVGDGLRDLTDPKGPR